MNPISVLLGLMVVVLLMVSANLFIGGFVDSPFYANDSGGYDDSEFKRLANETMKIAGDMNESASRPPETGLGAGADLVVYLFEGGAQAVGLLLKSVDLFDQLMRGITGLTGLPVGYAVVAVVGVVGLLAIVWAVSVWLGRDIRRYGQ